MRSVFVHLRNAAESEVAAFLSSRYQMSPTSPWVLMDDNRPVLYIDIYRGIGTEFEVEEWCALMDCLGGEPSVSVVADVSGRHPGDEAVRQFTCTLLRAFRGVAQDDYTNNFWTYQEIEERALVEGHPFFDYQGWYKDAERQQEENLNTLSTGGVAP